VVQQWAPAWFYSALNWLGKSYFDASNVPQTFNGYMLGSDVDPYAQLGSTRLFMISLFRNTFRLTVAADVNSNAPMSGGTSYPNTDAGIRQMYLDLSASPLFSSVKYCYVPGRAGSDINPNTNFTNFQCGYDPATGLRVVVLGSAVSQVVPLDDFLKTHNEQIYDDAPVIVPFVTALVYDVAQNNALGATTFNLPVYYTRDQVSSGNYYVNKLGWAGTVAGEQVQYGQTAVFPGGPGYNDAAASSLKVDKTAIVATGGESFTTYTFDTATVVTISALSPKVQTGIMSLTYSGSSPSSIFASQRIIGFYRDASWATCLGVPIYDYGAENSSFTAAALPLNAPVLIYNPSQGFLNGWSLQNVVHKLAQATYVYSPDQLVSILDSTIAVKDTTNGVGLSVTTAALDFDMSSSPATGVVDELTVPVLVSVTTTPPPVVIPNPVRGTPTANVPGAPVTTVSATGLSPNIAAVPKATVLAPAAAVSLPPKPIIGTITGVNLQQIIGGGVNNPSQSQPGPVTVQASLNASVPREALTGSGITSIEIGTAFPQQSLGSGATFESETAGTVLNLMNGAKPALAPFNLAISAAGVGFSAGIYSCRSREPA
jgi:hypothetical protein